MFGRSEKIVDAYHTSFTGIVHKKFQDSSGNFQILSAWTKTEKHSLVFRDPLLFDTLCRDAFSLTIQKTPTSSSLCTITRTLSGSLGCNGAASSRTFVLDAA